MTAYRYLQLDVFAHHPGTGNPLGVVFEVGRDGRVQVTVDAQGTVWIGGQVQPVIDGHITW